MVLTAAMEILVSYGYSYTSSNELAELTEGEQIRFYITNFNYLMIFLVMGIYMIIIGWVMEKSKILIK